MKKDCDINENDDFYPNTSLISVCCGAPPWGEVCDSDVKYHIPPTGICSICHDHTSFEQDLEEK
jgi:hypothetical protein